LITIKKINNLEYWNRYYGSDSAPKPPSDFAQYSLGYMEPHKMLIDLGCGNGRDSIFFFRSGLKVTAVDISKGAINSFDKNISVFTVCDDIVKTKALSCIEYDYYYSRWSIHAINQYQQDELLVNVYKSMKKGSLFFIEARTIQDVIYGKGEKLGKHEYFYNEHYRRFIDPEQLIGHMKKIGYEIVFNAQSNAFSVVEGDAPHLLRVIGRK
jgi:SAM-dependent methyltransferase